MKNTPIRRQKDGFYYVGDQKFKELVGRTESGKASYSKVWAGTAYKTPGGLTKDDLMHNGRRIVSKSRHDNAQKNKPLGDHLGKGFL